MRLLRVLHHRLRSILRRSKVEHDLAEELAVHLEQMQKEYIASGMTPADAAAAARREFGSVAVTQEECRDTRRLRLLDDLRADIIYACRLLAKSPAFTITAVLSLALGVGANTAMFSLVKQVILQLLPVRDPEQIVAIRKSSMQQPVPSNSFSHPFLRDLQSASHLPFDGIIGMAGIGRAVIMTESGAEPVTGEFVTGNYFDVLGVRPALGRVFTADDDKVPGAHPFVVLSYRYWQRRFGAGSAVLNTIVRINGQPFTIIGVSAANFDGLNPGYSPDVRVTFNMLGKVGPFGNADPLTSRGFNWLDIFARLKTGVSNEAAGSALMPMLARHYETRKDSIPRTEFQKKVRASERMHVIRAAQGKAGPRGAYERAIWVLSAIVAAVLLLACVNIAHLLLARASVRRREFNIRLAVGASRGRLIRQLLTESALVGVCGAFAGLLVAYGLGRIILSFVVSDADHSTLSAAPDWSLLAFNFAIALAASTAFGLVPALKSSRTGFAPDRRSLFGRKVLIGAQVAISLVLLAAAGLFVRSLIGLRNVDVGFRTDRILQVVLSSSSAHKEVLEQVKSVPGVQGAATAVQRLLAGSRWSSGINVQGFTSREDDHGPNRDAVGPGYFTLLGMPLLAGRDFTAADNATAPKVAIINEAFAKFYFAGRDPIGMRIGPGGSEPKYTIIGVTRNARYAQVREQTTRFWYVPIDQLGEVSHSRSLVLLIRTAVDPESMVNSIRAAVARVDKGLALFDVASIDAQLADNVRIEALLATLSTFFGAVAALLAGTGLFGVLSYSVTQRRREIGIRMAIGARPAQAAWTVVRDVGLYIVAGIFAGLGIALSLTSLVRGLLFGVEPNDPLSIALACLAISIVAVIAAALPASHAARIHPASTLRTE